MSPGTLLAPYRYCTVPSTMPSIEKALNKNTFAKHRKLSIIHKEKNHTYILSIIHKEKNSKYPSYVIPPLRQNHFCHFGVFPSNIFMN